MVPEFHQLQFKKSLVKGIHGTRFGTKRGPYGMIMVVSKDKRSLLHTKKTHVNKQRNGCIYTYKHILSYILIDSQDPSFHNPYRGNLTCSDITFMGQETEVSVNLDSELDALMPRGSYPRLEAHACPHSVSKRTAYARAACREPLRGTICARATLVLASAPAHRPIRLAQLKFQLQLMTKPVVC